ncbi:chaperone, ATP12 [Acetobacteraceae bacterium H6797]|nr:chaperone, ATP12 [Acetobacteraceae bacterium H6797]
MKRFWNNASIGREGDGFIVLLDGRPMRMPGGGRLSIERESIAQAVAEEWQAAGGGPGGEMTLEEVPLTRLLATAQDRIAQDPAAMVEGLAKYAETDLLCYRADDSRLAARQAEQWQPLLDWAALHLDAPLQVTDALLPISQPPASLAALEAAVAKHNAGELAALGLAVPALGSLVLGLALSHGRLDAAEAHRLAVLDETFQEERWGEDAEAVARRAKLAQDIALAARLLEVVRAP